MIAFLLLASASAWSQSMSPQVISAGSSSLRDAGFQLDGTLGQLASKMLQGSGFVISQGFEQPTLLATAIEVADVFEGLQLFPNPTENRLYLSFPKGFTHPPQITLSNMLGQVLLQASWPVGEQHMLLELSDLPAASYLLRLIEPQSAYTASFNILKIN